MGLSLPAKVVADVKVAEEGLRERKRRETLARIAEAGLKLFMTNGYEETTLEAIAEAAGISRRTFFYYFKSKEEILLAWQSHFTQLIRAAVIAEPSDQSPIDTVKNALLKLTGNYNSEQSLALDRVIRSSPALISASHAKYIAQEQAIFEALCVKWPQAKRRKSLRYVAMVAVGALRLAIESWSNDNGKRPPAAYLRESFANLQGIL
ncbi:TetR family transcriptional regulator [Bradyrhizobium sp. R2.2-H]|jgi:AcrR family transcriptional regulator|uniref:TetR/AcrR family transcriptional regulator n=1 Tax=unclassified Bradyrhizobium TaxID=2631580 RepID=UPI001043EEF9|nr:MULTISPECIES: TetR/AcrR family transcriptional regulator [unclassified Bradyrhizobium]TCU69363.1 TetR family transcriptional regulator [Bradyrhizobium sp. Y-H1]TCU70855.1 TetR family transcriptional regulator [Bradyrhizobium sp. R2.2-H]